MNRSPNDPRIVEVIRGFHRHAGSADGDAAQLTRDYVVAILGNGYNKEGILEDFPMPGLLALLTAYLQHAPEDEIDGSVAVTRARLAYLLSFEELTAFERATGEAVDWDFDYPRRLAEEFDRLAEEQAVQ